MGLVTTTITVTNQIDEKLAQRGFIPTQIRSITIENVLVDTGSTHLCLPADMILELGLPFQEEIEVKTVIEVKKTRLFKCVMLTVEGRRGEFECIELPGGEDPLLGVIPLEELQLQPDVINRRLILLPKPEKDS